VVENRDNEQVTAEKNWAARHAHAQTSVAEARLKMTPESAAEVRRLVDCPAANKPLKNHPSARS